MQSETYHSNMEELKAVPRKRQYHVKKSNIQLCFVVVVCYIAIFLLEMCQNQQSPLKNKKKSTRDYTGTLLTFSVF